MPQGTILGPTLFLIYVNGIPNVVTCTIKLFADDTKIYRELSNVDDTFALQSDLDSLENWTKSWQVKFRDRSFITSQGGAVVLEGGTILKQAPFWGVNFSLVRNMRGVKFYDTATAV